MTPGQDNWRQRYAAKRASPAGAIARIGRGKHIFISSGAATPTHLVEEMVREAARFADNQIVHLLTLGPAPYVEARYQDSFRHNAFFIGANVREAVREGRADYTPVFLSQIPRMMRTRRAPVDVALIQVSPPDEYGYVNLGVSVDIVLAAIESASLVIAQINSHMPVIHGAGYVSMDDIDVWVEHDASLPTVEREPLDEVALQIGRNVARLVEDTATLQVGIGQIPDAVVAALHDRSDLGVWTEMLPDGVVDLIRNGNVTGRYKLTEPRKVSASFTFGSADTYSFVDRNPLFSFQPSDYINNPMLVAAQHKMVAINGALEIDLTGQVCSDSIGSRFYSGIGGQVDFIRGASMCPTGKAVIALRSTAVKGTVSRIVPVLRDGAGVVTSRGDVEFVVTEYGIADLRARSIRERAVALISVAHPDFRAELLTAAKARRYVFVDQIAPRPIEPGRYEKTVPLHDGSRALLRPIRAIDEPKMSDLFYSLSEDTVYKRWMAPVPRMPHEKLVQYLDVDDVGNVAIVIERIGATRAAGRTETVEPELLGVGRYHLDVATGYADVALLIRDDWQGHGLGTTLFHHLVDIARGNGIDGFTAEVLRNNLPMLHVFHKSGLSIESSLSGDTYQLTIPFGSTTPDSSERIDSSPA